MFNFRLGLFLLAFLAIGSKGSNFHCYKCEGGERSACATGNVTGMESVKCETNRCAIATSKLAKTTLRTCFSGNWKMWDCLLTKFGKDGCVDMKSEATLKDPGFAQCLKAGQGNRKKRNANDFDTWCFCNSDHCNSGRNESHQKNLGRNQSHQNNSGRNKSDHNNSGRKQNDQNNSGEKFEANIILFLGIGSLFAFGFA